MSKLSELKGRLINVELELEELYIKHSNALDKLTAALDAREKAFEKYEYYRSINDELSFKYLKKWEYQFDRTDALNDISNDINENIDKLKEEKNIIERKIAFLVERLSGSEDFGEKELALIRLREKEIELEIARLQAHSSNQVSSDIDALINDLRKTSGDDD